MLGDGGLRTFNGRAVRIHEFLSKIFLVEQWIEYVMN